MSWDQCSIAWRGLGNAAPLWGIPVRVSIVMGAWKRLSRSALPSTKTLERAIAAAAKIGESNMPFTG